MIPKSNKTNRAFTLLELLITLTLFSAIMGVVLNSFFQFKQQGIRVEAILKLRQELRILEKIIRKDLRSVIYLSQYVIPTIDQIDERKSGVIGISESNGETAQDTIHMHVHRESSFQRGLPIAEDPKVHEVSYFVEETEDVEKKSKFILKRREEFYIDNDMTEGDEGESITHTLSEKILSFDIQYFKQQTDEPEEEWDSNDMAAGDDPLPAGFKVSITLIDSTKEVLKTSFQVNLHAEMGTLAVWNNL
ncbi:MAG: prepilin-type N-terminal cleavage/methylation domain-containing protein [Proteobacteria bacterium]|nr:prepilin-type N-terminal cleavage/methylation domain-containing protein [Pseudomonadota bacterium]